MIFMYEGDIITKSMVTLLWNSEDNLDLELECSDGTVIDNDARD